MWWREAFDVEQWRRELSTRHPALHFVDGVEHKLRGSFVVEHEGRELDRFAVEVDLAPVLQGQLPSLKEVGGRIPREEERHINRDGSACVCLPEDYYFTNPGPFDLLAYLDGAVRSFFLGQALVERGDPWPYGEWKHGTDGVAEWVKQFFEAMPSEVRRAYLQLLRAKELKGHVPCPCGSGKKLRGCHYQLIQELRRGYRPPGRARRGGPKTRHRSNDVCFRSSPTRLKF